MSKKIKFKIGEQYEKHEFELDWIKSVLDDNLRYEVYQYFGKYKITIFDCEVQKILLAYNCDFLSGVFYFIDGKIFSKIISDMQHKFSETRTRNVNLIKMDKEIWMIYEVAKKNNFDILVNDIIKLGQIYL